MHNRASPWAATALQTQPEQLEQRDACGLCGLRQVRDPVLYVGPLWAMGIWADAEAPGGRTHRREPDEARIVSLFPLFLSLSTLPLREFIAVQEKYLVASSLNKYCNGRAGPEALDTMT